MRKSEQTLQVQSAKVSQKKIEEPDTKNLAPKGIKGINSCENFFTDFRRLGWLQY